MTQAPLEIVPCHEDPRLAVEDPDLADPSLHASREAGMLRALSPQLQVQLTVSPLRKSAYYPPADRSTQYFGGTLSAVDFTWVRAVVDHSTETAGWPGYQGGLTAPNLTCYPDQAKKKLFWRHHFRLNQSARALLHPPGTVSTNTSNVVQTETIGTCEKDSAAMKAGAMYLAEPPDWFIEQYGEFLQFMNEEWGVPLVSSVKWESYPASYGKNNGVRLGDQAWLSYHGFLAHQHVANNDHGDVLVPVKMILAAAISGDDMALSADDKKWLDDMVDAKIRWYLGQPWVNADSLLPSGAKSDDKIAPVTMIQNAYLKLAAQLKAIQTVVGDDPTLDQIVQAFTDRVIQGGGTLDKEALKQALVEVFHSADANTTA